MGQISIIMNLNEIFEYSWAVIINGHGAVKSPSFPFCWYSLGRLSNWFDPYQGFAINKSTLFRICSPSICMNGPQVNPSQRLSRVPPEHLGERKPIYNWENPRTPIHNASVILAVSQRLRREGREMHNSKTPMTTVSPRALGSRWYWQRPLGRQFRGGHRWVLWFVGWRVRERRSRTCQEKL